MGAAELVVTALAIALAAAVQSTTGFGFALLAVPLLSLVVPADDAVVVSASLGLVSSATIALASRAHGDRVAIGRMLVGAAIGAPLGLALLEITTGRQLRFVLAGVIATYLVVELRGWQLRHAGRGIEVGAGVVSGALNTALSTNGPPLVMALHARQLPPDAFRATITAVLAGSGLFTVVLFGVSGRYDGPIAAQLAVALPALGLGYLLGARHRRRLAPATFHRLVLALLAVTGAVTLVGAVLA